MTATVVLYREIEPEDAERCTGRCPWREGQLCTLFFVQLVPKTRSLFETDCQRSSECKTAQMRAEERDLWKRRDERLRKRA